MRGLALGTGGPNAAEEVESAVKRLARGGRRQVAQSLTAFTQHGIGQQFGKLRAHRSAVGISLSRASTLLEATSTRCSVAPQLTRDRRWRSTKLPGNLPNAFAAGMRQRDLFTLGEVEVPPCGL